MIFRQWLLDTRYTEGVCSQQIVQEFIRLHVCLNLDERLENMMILDPCTYWVQAPFTICVRLGNMRTQMFYKSIHNL